jgi:hypothetical protein
LHLVGHFHKIFNKFVYDAVWCVYNRQGNDVTIYLLTPTTYTISKPVNTHGCKKTSIFYITKGEKSKAVTTHAMKLYMWPGVVTPLILIFSARWRLVVSLTPRLLYPRERATGIHWVGRWEGLRAGLKILEKRYIRSVVAVPTANGSHIEGRGRCFVSLLCEVNKERLMWKTRPSVCLSVTQYKRLITLSYSMKFLIWDLFKTLSRKRSFVKIDIVKARVDLLGLWISNRTLHISLQI